MLLRLAYLTVTSAFAALRLLSVGDRDKDVEILALRHQITVLQRQLRANRVTADRVRFAPEYRAFLATFWSDAVPNQIPDQTILPGHTSPSARGREPQYPAYVDSKVAAGRSASPREDVSPHAVQFALRVHDRKQ